jgi:hypothetical protein
LIKEVKCFKSLCFKIIILFILILSFSNESFPDSTIRKYRYEFEFPSYPGNVWIPVPQEHNLQYNSTEITLIPSPTDRYFDKINDNNLLFFTNLEGGVKGEYELISYLPMSIAIDPKSIGVYDKSSDLYMINTKSETWIESDNVEIVQKAQSIAGDEGNPFLAAKLFFNFVASHLEPGSFWVNGMTPEEYRNGYGALATYRRGTGTCQNYALLFVALCRAKGIPARTVHGINLPGELPIENEKIEDWSHSWAEIYLPNYGWVPADPIYLEYSKIDLGELPTFRIVLAIGNNISLNPACTNAEQCWYCGIDGKALFIGYPIPYVDYRFTVTVTGVNGCLSVAGDLGIWVPCAEYNGTQYGFTLDFYSNPDDPTGYYWKLDKATLTGGTGTDIISISGDLSMSIPCVSYNGTQYGFTLRFYNNPDDPSGYYWKMDKSTLEVK